MDKSEVDIVAASRIARRVDLQKIHLTEIKATCVSGAGAKGPLKPTYEYHCFPVKVDAGNIEIGCTYKFHVSSQETELANANMTYHLVYKLFGDEPTDEGDIEHFAHANGTYHSWPFVRELIFGLTSRMGFPPYTLPVMSFLPRPKPKAKPEAEGGSVEAKPSETTRPEVPSDRE